MTDDLLIDLIQNSNSSRELIKGLLELELKSKGRFKSQAQFAEEAQISKSLLSEYLNGVKNLSFEKYKKICQLFKTIDTLKNRSAHQAFYKYLIFVFQVESKLIDSNNSKFVEYTSELNKKKQEVIKEISQSIQESKKLDPVLFDKNNARVYASLGSSTNGVHLSEILLKSKLNEKIVLKCVQNLMQIGLVSCIDNKFYPIQNQIYIHKPSENDLIKLTEQVCSHLLNSSEKLVLQKNGFIEMTSFSIKSNSIENFKSKLRDSVFNVINEFEDNSGDSIYDLNIFGL